jgi:hypothetical protein
MVKKIMITNRISATSVIPITELAGKPFTDTPVSLAKTQEVAEYDNWFLQDVEKGLTKITAEKSLES